MGIAPIFDTPIHPSLEKLAAGYSDWMARHKRQGAHHGFQERYDEVKEKLGLHAVEITAESWVWQGQCSQDELWEEAVKCWKTSPGHWRIASVPHKALGMAMAKGRNGIWYFVCLVAD